MWHARKVFIHSESKCWMIASLFQTMEIQQWMKQSPCFPGAYNTMYWGGVGEKRVNKEHIHQLMISVRKKNKEIKTECGCNFT